MPGQKTLADRFLEDARDAALLVSVYLVSGFQLKGNVVEFDKEAILFIHKNVHQLVMRSAVASIYPSAKPKDGADEWWQPYATAAVD
jgi:host factor-I protein